MDISDVTSGYNLNSLLSDKQKPASEVIEIKDRLAF
jgi:hypothetical protein